jgi:hypothetical protein
MRLALLLAGVLVAAVLAAAVSDPWPIPTFRSTIGPH